MATAVNRVPRLAYVSAWTMLALAASFPIALMVFNPVLMFQRGWEQYVGTGIYIWALLTLGRELLGLAHNERAFSQAATWVNSGEIPPASDHRYLPSRLRQLLPAQNSADRVMELNREASGLDQEQAAGRFTLTRYILYLLPVIGFIGTVEGISKALMNISRVLPMVKDLDGFLGNLTSVTAALQIAFDSTLLALFLSASLMLIQTLVYRRAEDLLARVDRWVVETVLPRGGHDSGPSVDWTPAVKALEDLSNRMGTGLGAHLERFADSIARLNASLVSLEKGAAPLADLGSKLEPFGATEELVRKGIATLGRIETTLASSEPLDEPLEAIRRGVERTGSAVESLSEQWSNAFERTSRATQEQLARTLGSLKEALDLLHVSMEQSNALYRNIVRSKFQVYREDAS